ncbi:phosphatidylserine decarboxylase [Plasmopara halstedii]|uniref:Phosphatidylserine decarboxylase proenzyme, mitochondrial n=1 Tax=Plasmopara halstedii TaxID=4781 RepID=A0A0P1AVM5_PLAHL|nr:phosphatidylserine decarboxylase [Plasmopara halstedii]CEG46262.1 phosphatidylserine decarboxylase [Plasmopara halstedii]|eukprot:XP_024582631.1 phosphatidylserine decarboxylase [Plasmopara halstedii]
MVSNSRSPRYAAYCRSSSKSQQQYQVSQQTNQKQVCLGKETSSSMPTRNWKLLVTMSFALIGFALISLQQWEEMETLTDELIATNPASGLRRLYTTVEMHTSTDKMASKGQLQSLKLLPYRAASRLWGKVHNKKLPRWMRKPVYKSWATIFKCNLTEMKYPLQDYANLGEFFSRPLKEGLRPFVTDPHHLASPVDGAVASVGFVNSSADVPTLEQIKGSSYRLDEFLGGLPPFFTAKTPGSNGKQVYYCVLYLAPGDYHRVHAPVDWKVETRRHFPGNLFPVNHLAANRIPSLYLENERVALLGEWEHGFFSLTAVGALNVGSIVLTMEPGFRTNTHEQDKQVGQCLATNYTSKVDTLRGEEIALFKFGSTVVLIFEAPASFQFTIKPGDKVALGKTIGKLKGVKPN